MGNRYLAVDLGASGGRVIMGRREEGKLVLREIHRFENGMKRKGNSLVWDYDGIFEEILRGFQKCAGGEEAGEETPCSAGIDTWGVDYVLLDAKGDVLGETYGYRDHRTDGMWPRIEEIISAEDLYARTGNLNAVYNTICQLMADRTYRPEILETAQHLLMVPDYFNYLLTGRMVCEYTEASTSQLLKRGRRQWDDELIRMLGYPGRIFREIIPPGTTVGSLTEKMAERIGYRMNITATASHDTASAIAALPLEEDDLYISSGTWSLMGCVLDRPLSNEECRKRNFTNEGGFGNSICFHKNIMGLWMIQSLRKEIARDMSFAMICEEAEKNRDFPSRVDVNSNCFLSPESMTKALREYCKDTGQAVPGQLGEYAALIYHSLADCYAETAREVELLTGKSFKRIVIGGGGSSAEYLNRLTADKSGKTVAAGIKEATAAGNILIQMICTGELKSLEEARELVRASFPMK